MATLAPSTPSLRRVASSGRLPSRGRPATAKARPAHAAEEEEGAAAHASAAALSVTSKANARAELTVLGAAAAPIRRGSKVWRGAARKV